MGIRTCVLGLARHAGIVVVRTRSKDPWWTISRLLAGRSSPLVLDVGANYGQTALHVSRLLPHARIYSFEPSPVVYGSLAQSVASLPNVTPLNMALGEEAGRMLLRESSLSEMTSFYRPDVEARGVVIRETEVEVRTVDAFRKENAIDRIDVLKTDTQGFDLSVLKGAEDSLREGRIDVILTELTFTRMYDHAPRFDELLTYTLDLGFELVGLFPTHEAYYTTWADAIMARHGVRPVPRASS